MGLPPMPREYADRRQEHNSNERGESVETQRDALRAMFRGHTHRAMEQEILIGKNGYARNTRDSIRDDSQK